MKKGKSEKINDRTHLIPQDEMEDALGRSGYFLEQRARKAFEHGAFSATTNTSFLDPHTKKSREIDLEAEMWRKPFDDFEGTFAFKVIAECKNKFQPIVFFVQAQGLLSQIEFEWRIKGSPTYIVDDRDRRIATISFEDDLSSRHVWRSEKCTQWCTFKFNEKLETWVASGDEEDYLSLQSLMIATRERAESFHKSVKHTEFTLGIFQPLLILQNDFYIAEEIEGSVKIRKSKRIALRSQYTHYSEDIGTHRENFMIDVISESYLPEYIKKLQEGISQITSILEPKKNWIIKEMARRQG